jgi:hypothetical protein
MPHRQSHTGSGHPVHGHPVQATQADNATRANATQANATPTARPLESSGFPVMQIYPKLLPRRWSWSWSSLDRRASQLTVPGLPTRRVDALLSSVVPLRGISPKIPPGSLPWTVPHKATRMVPNSRSVLRTVPRTVPRIVITATAPMLRSPQCHSVCKFKSECCCHLEVASQSPLYCMSLNGVYCGKQTATVGNQREDIVGHCPFGAGERIGDCASRP